MNFFRRNGVRIRLDGEKVPVSPVLLSGCGQDLIPELVAREAYKEYIAQFGDCQSFERINERGGFGSAELAILLYERIKRLEADARRGFVKPELDGN